MFLSQTIPKNRGLIFLSCTLALLLNHTSRLAGFNLSLADVVLPILLFALVAAQRLIIPRSIAIAMLLLLSVTITTALWITPLTFGTLPVARNIIGDTIKLLVSMLYLIAGYSLASTRLQGAILRWFAFGAVMIGLLSIANTFFSVPLPAEMYFAATRFRGFMSDPNFYATISVAALIIVYRDKSLIQVLRWAGCLVLMLSVIFSGSKTGLILLTVALVILATGPIFTKTRWVIGLPFLLFSLSITTILSGKLIEMFRSFFEFGSSFFPQLHRLSLLLSDDFSDAISQQGSGRSTAWSNAIQVIEQVPFLGTGVGSYQIIASNVTNSTVLAHNTYLQIAAEWGLPFAIIFFGWIGILLVKASVSSSNGTSQSDLTIVLRDVTIVFLIAGASLSLNNARMFWLFLGMLAYSVISGNTLTQSSTSISSRRTAIHR